MTMVGVAIAAGAINMNHICRAPNCNREGCLSTEDQYGARE